MTGPRNPRAVARGAASGNRHGAGLKTLDDLGLDEDESRRFQQIAAVPQAKFDAHLAEARRGAGAEGRSGAEVTSVRSTA